MAHLDLCSRDEESMKTFGQIIKEAQISKDISNHALANGVGVTVQHLRLFELNKRQPSYQTAVDILKFLEIPHKRPNIDRFEFEDGTSLNFRSRSNPKTTNAIIPDLSFIICWHAGGVHI